jgi:hypothetical protein
MRIALKEQANMLSTLLQSSGVTLNSNIKLEDLLFQGLESTSLFDDPSIIKQCSHLSSQYLNIGTTQTPIWQNQPDNIDEAAASLMKP